MTDIRIAVVSLWAEDVPAAARFYRDVIGLRLLAHHSHERPHFELGGAYLVILKGRLQSDLNPLPPRFPLIALAVPDLDSSVDRLRVNGVELPWGIEEGTDSRWVIFHDPAGNLIELIQFK